MNVRLHVHSFIVSSGSATRPLSPAKAAGYRIWLDYSTLGPSDGNFTGAILGGLQESHRSMIWQLTCISPMRLVGNQWTHAISDRQRLQKGLDQEYYSCFRAFGVTEQLVI